MYSEEILRFAITITLVCNCFAKPTSTRFCGVHLNDALKLACGPNGYNSPAWEPDNNSRTRAAPGPGVATECCHNGCTWRTIVSYCADPSRRRIRKSEEASETAESFGSAVAGSAKMGGEDEVKLAASAPEVKRGARGQRGAWKRKNRDRIREKNKNKDKRRGRRGGRRCTCRRRRRLRLNRRRSNNKTNFENIKRTAPVFGTVSPEYLRQPRTLDGVLPVYSGFSPY